MIYEMKTLNEQEQLKAIEYMKNYTNSSRYSLTKNHSKDYVDLSPINPLFENYQVLCNERLRINPASEYFDYVSIVDGEVLGLFHFEVKNKMGYSFSIYRSDRNKPFAFGKDVQAAYYDMHKRTKQFTVVVYLHDDNKTELNRINGRGIVYHLSKKYNIMSELHTLVKYDNEVYPVMIVKVQGALL